MSEFRFVVVDVTPPRLYECVLAGVWRGSTSVLFLRVVPHRTGLALFGHMETKPAYMAGVSRGPVIRAVSHLLDAHSSRLVERNRVLARRVIIEADEWFFAPPDGPGYRALLCNWGQQ